jgi:glycosyltransferase involved in cell wall biosynthesis
MAPEKNYSQLFRIYESMRAANPRLRFVLAGEGPLEQTLKREHPECIFAGFFSREEIGRYYASADIYIHASTSETFGNVVTEAMASGLAVLSYDYAAGRQFIRHGENGLLAPLGDEARFEKLAIGLATDEVQRSTLKVAAPLSVQNQSWEKVIEDFEGELMELIKTQGLG